MDGVHIKNYDSPTPVTGKEWTTEEMTAEFEAIGFAAPFIIVRRKSDSVLGTLEFKHSPRKYWGFRPTPDGS